jgi:hypothetical protein
MSKKKPLSPSAKPDIEELDIPDGVGTAQQSVEVLRAFIADGALMVSINADAFGPRVKDWGRLIAEISHHVAHAAELQGHMSEQEALTHLRKVFDETLRHSQPTMTGKIRGRVNH